MIKIYKTLTRNDTGETHSHQSGITIPVKVAKSGVFPDMGTDKLNPRVPLLFYDENHNLWEFQYIYYNDVFFGKPRHQAHNEHRLTCITKYIAENDIKSGDSVWFSIDEKGVRRIGFERAEQEIKTEKVPVIKLGKNWRYIQY